MAKRSDRLQKLADKNVQLEATGARRPFRADGYINLMNKYGTGQDNSEAYQFAPEGQIPDTALTQHYEADGLFSKIIDIPAQEAVKKGFKLNISDEKVEEYIQKKLRLLDYKTFSEDALKWSRLYGGAIGVMLIDDGCDDLTIPVDWKKARAIEEVDIYDRSVVTPDYSSLYSNYGMYGFKRRSKFRMPEYYNVFSVFGAFRVHESRCLVFRNGKMPEKTSTTEFRFWGIPEYNRIKRALRETVTAHGDAVKLLERCVQAVYKMQNLSQTLATDEGEDQVIRRLQIIDMARGILNSVAIDKEGEDYDFKSITLTGVREVIDSACNMLSALTEIPQTKLFGRSPAGMNATGESDLENYYNFIDKIRALQLRDNYCLLVDAIIQIGINNGELKEKPDYELEFEPLWNEKETDRVTIDQSRAQTQQVQAQTEQLYVDMGVLDPSEIRKRLKREGRYDIENEELPAEQSSFESIIEQLSHKDEDDIGSAKSVGVLVEKDGLFLVGNRDDNNQVGGPGGHVESWEDAFRAAVRETEEEFGITLDGIMPIGVLQDLPKEYGKPAIFLATGFSGEVLQDTAESRNNRFMNLSDLQNEDLYIPFQKAVELLFAELRKSKIADATPVHLTSEADSGTIVGVEDEAEFKESEHPRDKDGKFTSGSGSSGGASDDKKKDPTPKPSTTLAVPEGAALRQRLLADTEGKITADEIISDPVVQKAIESYKYEPKDETILIDTPEREQERQRAADEVANSGSITGYDEDGQPKYDGPVTRGFRAEIVIGPPAAGKSSVIVDRVSKNTQARVLDSDEVKKRLSGYDDGRGAGKVHEESSHILEQRIMPQFYEGGQHHGDNLVIPIVGKNPRKVEKYLQALKSAGYEVHLSFNDVKPETSMKRAVCRYISEGRWLNPVYIRDVGRSPEATYEAMKRKGGFASYSRYNNDVPKGQPATKVERVNANGESINWEDWQ